MLPTTISPPRGNSTAGSTFRTSSFTTSARGAAARSAGSSRRSSSTATTRRADRARPAVSVPGPAPTSSTSSSGPTPAAATTRSRSPSSTRKCCPSRLRGRGGRGSAPALEPRKERPDVGPLQLCHLLQGEAAQLCQHLRGVHHPGRAHAPLPPPGRPPGRVGLDEEPVCRDPPRHLAQVLPAGPSQHARKGDVQAQVQEAAGPVKAEHPVVHHPGQALMRAEDLVHGLRALPGVHAHGEPQLHREGAAGVEPLLLGVVRAAVLVGVVEAHLADRDDAGPGGQLAEQPEVGTVRVERVVADGRPDAGAGGRPPGDLAAGGPVHTHGDQVADPGLAGLGQDVVEVAVHVLEVHVGVDQGHARACIRSSSSSTTLSSSLRNSAFGSGSGRPAGTSLGRHRGVASYSSPSTTWRAPSSSSYSLTTGWGAITPPCPSISWRRWLENGRNGVSSVFRLSTQRMATNRVVAARARSSLMRCQGCSSPRYWLTSAASRRASEIAALNRAV